MNDEFVDACNELNDAIAEVEDAFAEKFKVRAQTGFIKEQTLVFKKHGDRRSFHVSSGVHGTESYVTTPLLSANLEWRIASVQYFEALWEACVMEDTQASRRIVEAVAEANAFLSRKKEN